MTRLILHVKHSPNYNRLQSAYRRGHSTETALLRMMNDVYCAADNGYRTILLQHDLSAAFDTIDISTLLYQCTVASSLSFVRHSWPCTQLDCVVSGLSRTVRPCRPATVVEHGQRARSSTRARARPSAFHIVHLAGRSSDRLVWPRSSTQC